MPLMLQIKDARTSIIEEAIRLGTVVDLGDSARFVEAQAPILDQRLFLDSYPRHKYRDSSSPYKTDRGRARTRATRRMHQRVRRAGG